MRLMPARIRRTARERGASATIVAVILVPVAFGAAMISADVGKLLFERRELQNAADAGALLAARQCFTAATCGPSGLTGLQGLVNANAQDGLVTVAQVCRSSEVSSASLPICTSDSATAPADADAITSCPWNSGLSTRAYVEVRTSTLTAEGNKVRAPFKEVAGGDSGTEVNACARAGMVAGYDPLNVLPITQSLCAWEAATDNGTDFPPLPPYSTSPSLPASDNPSASVPSEIDLDQIAKIVVMNDPNNGAADCGKDPTTPGLYTPGNFGWLDEASGCSAITVDSTIGGTGGVSSSSDCSTILPQKVGKVVYLPITTGSSGTGQNTVYNVAGLAAFYLAGVDFEGNAANKLFNGFKPKIYDPSVSAEVLIGCDKETQGCLWGWYLEPLVPGGTPAPPGGGSFGPKTIALLG